MAGLQFLVLLCCLCLLSVAEATSETARNIQASQPHIVFIIADDLGYNDVGYHGSEIETPTLDALAKDGVRLENYYVQPICTPTRSQLMSGRYQIHTGLQHDVISAPQPNGLPLDSLTMADKIKEAGYSTHMVGKWHLGFYKEGYLPWKRGFDTYYGYFNAAEDYYNHTVAYQGHPYLDLHDQNGPIWTENGTYSTFPFTNQAMNVIHSHDPSKPLFLYLAYQNVHAPLEVPEEYVKKYQHIQDQNRRIYAGMVSALDEGVANVTDALKQAGLWDNTILVFSTDNGGEIHQGGNNYPLRGWKHSLWEGGLHGVGFVSGGAMKTKGVINHQLLHVSDWFPTLVTLAGGNLNGTKPLDGFDQWETIVEDSPSKRKVLLHNIDPLVPMVGPRLFNDTWDTRVRAAIRVGDLKLITGNPYNGTWVPPPNDYLYVIPEPEPSSRDVKNLWLFNITADPTEHTDLSDKMPDVVKEMLDMIVVFNETAVPCRFPRPDPRSNPALHGDVWSPWE